MTRTATQIHAHVAQRIEQEPSSKLRATGSNPVEGARAFLDTTILDVSIPTRGVNDAVSRNITLKLLPYDVDEDDAAEQYVREALRRSQRGNWKALIAEDHVMLTYRALCRIEAGAP